MPVNVEKMKQERANRQGSSDLLDLAEGETCIYICAPFRDEDETPYWECKMHYGLGPKSKNSGMCLDPTNNPILSNPAFIEQAEELKKDLSGGCPICEAMDRGEQVSGEEGGGKLNGRWLWMAHPLKFRADSRQAFAPWKDPNEVKGFLTGYRVWDAISDVFGSCGDVSDPDQATLVRVIRKGVKLNTEWTVQADLETAKKPMKLSAGSRAAIAAACQPGGSADPMRILAGMARTRKDMEAMIAGFGGGEAAGEYETQGESTEATEEKAANFKPPGKGGKPAAAAAKPAAAKPAAKAAAPAAKAGAKPSTKETISKAKDKEEAKFKLLVAERGQPPSCYKVDCDPNEDVCQKCPWKVECAEHMGVPTPPDPSEVTDEQEEEAETAAILADQAEVGSAYVIDETGEVYTYKGPAKGKHFFVAADGGSKKVEPGTEVIPVASDEPEAEEEAAEPETESEAEDNSEEEQRMKALEAELAKRKGTAKPAAAKPAAAKPAAKGK